MTLQELSERPKNCVRQIFASGLERSHKTDSFCGMSLILAIFDPGSLTGFHVQRVVGILVVFGLVGAVMLRFVTRRMPGRILFTAIWAVLFAVIIMLLEMYLARQLDLP